MSALPVVEVRPQTALLIFFGDHVAGDDGSPELVVAGRDVLTILARLGVGEHAARATLARMVRRGLLHRELRGRRAYFGLTDRGRTTMLDGRRRGREEGPQAAPWDGRWTLVAFSMPESWQSERHDLRSRLLWAGFGPAQSGLWVAPRRVDVSALVEGLRGAEHVRAFDAVPLAPTDASRLVEEAYDLAAIGAGYAAFEARWRPVAEDVVRAPDPLGAGLLLTADWLTAARADPRLPGRFLPPDWPALAAGALFRRLAAELAPRVAEQLAREVELVPPGGATRVEGRRAPTVRG